MELFAHGLHDVIEHPAVITDTGVQIAGKLFGNLRNLTIYNCPHLRNPLGWLVEGESCVRFFTARILSAPHGQSFRQWIALIHMIFSNFMIHNFYGQR